jgi:hypothetical protein
VAISLDKVTYTNFRSFVGTHVVEFEKSGLCLIQGTNLDSFGESGSGKSSVILGICYLIGINTYPAKELQSWHTEDPMEVVGEFSVNGEPLTIARGKRLTVTHKGETIVGKEAESHIDRILGVSAAMRGALVYRGQKAPGLFLSMTDSEKKEFLTELLGLNIVEQAIADSAVKVKTLEESVSKQKITVNMLEHEFSRLPVKPNDPDPLFEVHKVSVVKKLEEWTNELAVRNSLHSECSKKETAELSTLSEHKDTKLKLLNSQIKFHKEQPFNTELDELTAKFTEVSDRLDRIKATDKKLESDLVTQRQHALSFIKETEKEIKIKEKAIADIEKQQSSLIKGDCYACGSPDKQAAQAYQNNLFAIEQLNLQIAELSKTLVPLDESKYTFTPNPLIEQFRTARDAIYKKQTEVALNNESALNARIQPIKDQIATIERTYFEELVQIKDRYKEELDKHRSQCKQLEDEIRTAKAQLATIESDYAYSAKAIAQWQVQLDRIQALIEEAITKRDSFNVSLSEELDCQELLKGFLDRIFLEVLDQITQEANATMGSLPNIAHLSLQFQTEKTTGKGTTKQSITPVVYFKGSHRPLKSGCSGGMYTSVELAVDWALFKVISERTGTSFNFIMLDEVFTGLDNVTKTHALEVLQRVASDKLIICIDHSSETKQLFNQTINVLLKDEKSVIVSE